MSLTLTTRPKVPSPNVANTLSIKKTNKLKIQEKQKQQLNTHIFLVKHLQFYRLNDLHHQFEQLVDAVFFQKKKSLLMKQF